MFSLIRFIRSKRNLRQFLGMLDALGDRDLTATDIVTLKEPLRSTLSGAIRAGRISREDLAKDLELSLDGASRLANVLVRKGIFQSINETTYDVRVSGKTFSHERPGTRELWAKFDKDRDDTK